MENETINTALTQQDYQSYWGKGSDYATYYNEAEQQASLKGTEGYAQYLPLNFQRMKRIPKTLVLSEILQTTLASLPKKIYWLVISEAWCGDASQIMPVLHSIAEASSKKIEMRVVLRDQNLPLIDAHLTGTGRAIPKLVQLDEQFNITGTWGPRPAATQALMAELKEKGLELPAVIEAVHKWYAEDKQAAIQTEILELLKG